MCDINPKDIETWSIKSSSHTGGGGSGENNGSNPNNPGGNGNGSGNNSNPSSPVDPQPNYGWGGFSLERP